MGWTHTLGMLSVLATLALLSPGVQAVRADSPAAALRSVDPVLMEGRTEVADPVLTETREGIAGPVERSDAKPGRPVVAQQPGVTVLNTRGYNYGPPVGEVDPRAMDLERALAPPPPAAAR